MEFPFRINSSEEIRIEQLQLEERMTFLLRKKGIRTVAELICNLEQNEKSLVDSDTLFDALANLAFCQSGREVDWYKFWEHNGFRLSNLHLTSKELDFFEEEQPDLAVEAIMPTPVAEWLKQIGCPNFRNLISNLKTGNLVYLEIDNQIKSSAVEELLKLAADIRSGRSAEDVTKSALLKKKDSLKDIRYTENNGFQGVLHPDNHELPIGILHAGTKANILTEAGYYKIADISGASRATLLSLPSMGKNSVDKIESALNSLIKSQDEAGRINWDNYCAAISIPLLPAEKVALDGNTFAAMVGTTLGQLGRTLNDPVLQKIISDRISRPPQQRATLEDIGSSLPEPITRERIRQREAKLLEALAAALVNDDYARLNVHFRPEFAAYWKRAAEHFDDASEEITFAALVDGLIDTWGADRAVLLEHLPLIATVITGEVMSSSSFGDATRLDPRLLTLSEADRDIPLCHLQIGRSARALRVRGMESIRDLILSIRQGKISRASGVHYRTAIEHLDLVAASLDADNRLNWSKYFEVTGAKRLPSTDPATPIEFFQTLSTNVSTIIAANPPTGRSREIFDLRTARPISTRLTMEKVAKALKTYGPSVKREETYTLSYLNEVIIEGDHALAGIGLRPGFARMWQRINHIFDEANGDAQLFQRYLAAGFGVEEEDVEPAMPTMIAVLTGYPYGRLGRYTRMVPELVVEGEEPMETKEVAEESTHIRIKLKGFRRMH